MNCEVTYEDLKTMQPAEVFFQDTVDAFYIVAVTANGTTVQVPVPSGKPTDFDTDFSSAIAIVNYSI